MTKLIGAETLLKQLEGISKTVDDEEMINAAYDAWKLIGDKMRENAAPYNEYGTGLLLDPRTIMTLSGLDKDKEPFAEAGVYKYDKVMATYPLPHTNNMRDPNKDIPPPTYAYWLEYGVAPHYLTKGTRRKNEPVVAGGEPERRKHEGIAATHFMSRAYNSEIGKVQEKFKDNVNKLLHKAAKK